MKGAATSSLFAFFCLHAAAAAATAAEAECEPLGAARQGARSELRVCTAEAGWLAVPAPAAPGPGGGRAPSDCTGQAGALLCDTTCSLVGVCLNTGAWLQTQNCAAAGKVCINGTCATDDGTPCQSLEGAYCFSEGNFPSLVDCSRYYNCSEANADAEPAACDAGAFYDACTEKCDVEASDACPWAVASPCSEAGAFAVAPNNDRLYYVCAPNAQGQLVPSWSACETGHFNVDTLQCEDKGVPGCVAPPTTPSTTTTTTTTNTAAPPDTPGPFQCQAPGLAANPDTNCSFYYCHPDGTSELIPCNDGFHYNPATGACQPGQCTP